MTEREQAIYQQGRADAYPEGFAACEAAIDRYLSRLADAHLLRKPRSRNGKLYIRLRESLAKGFHRRDP